MPCITRGSFETILSSGLLSIEERNTVLFALYTGMRESEQWALRPESFSTDEKGIVWMERTLAKTSVHHRVALITPAVEVLRSQLALLAARQDQSGWLFPSRSGGQRKGTPKDLDFVLRLCQPRDGGPSKSLRWHSLRNSNLTGLVEGWFGVALTETEAQLYIGHTTLAQTRAYHRAQLAQTKPELFRAPELPQVAREVPSSNVPTRAPTRRPRRPAGQTLVARPVASVLPQAGAPC
jgi:integrase